MVSDVALSKSNPDHFPTCQPCPGSYLPLGYLTYRGCIRPSSNLPTDVDFSFHCVSLHETRAPYTATLMRGARVHQVYFPGTHSNLGWIDDVDDLVHGPFAWMIQQLHTHLHISFNEAKLAARFPSYRPAGATALNPTIPNPAEPIPDRSGRWFQGPISLAGPGILAVMGKKTRRPGQPSNTATAAGTDVQMHIVARLRAHLDDDVEAVPGYVLVVPATGRLY